MRQRVRRSSLIVSVLPSYRRKPREPSLPLIRQREQQRYRSQLQVCPFLRGHGRHDAQFELLHPRRIRYAPLSKNRHSVGRVTPAVKPRFVLSQQADVQGQKLRRLVAELTSGGL